MPPQQIKIIAYRLGETIHLKNLKLAYKGEVYFSSPTEVFIKKEEQCYIYVQNYGEIAFSNCDASLIAEFIHFARQFVDAPGPEGKEYKEDFLIEVAPDQKLAFGYTSMRVPEINSDVIKIAMLNVSQSVVLDHFTELAQQLLRDTGKFTLELEAKGKLSASKINLMKFIGKTLKIQSRITDNLYFLDAPDTVWDDEYLSHINNGLSRTFNLKTRFKEVEYTLKIVDKNLGIFSQLVQHRDSNKLEWVIIILILIEVTNVLLSRVI